MLSAESAVRIVGGWATHLQAGTVIPILAGAVLVWLIWRTLRPR